MTVTTNRKELVNQAKASINKIWETFDISLERQVQQSKNNY